MARPNAEALASASGGIICSVDSAALEPINKNRTIRAGRGRRVVRTTIGWRCPKCGAGFNANFGRDSSLDRGVRR